MQLNQSHLVISFSLTLLCQVTYLIVGMKSIIFTVPGIIQGVYTGDVDVAGSCKSSAYRQES